MIFLDLMSSHAVSLDTGISKGELEIMPAQAKSQTGRQHEVGTLTAPLLTLDLNREIEQLRSEGR
jgi:hypothetical protein